MFKTRCLTQLFIILVYTGLTGVLLYLPNFFKEHGISLNVYTFADTIDEAICRKFEQETGVVVNLKYYDTAGEFITEIQACKGRGYDLLASSDNTVELLRKQSFLKRLDHSKIEHLSSLDHRLLNHYFDPGNNYSIPFCWSVFGVGYDKRVFPEFSNQMSWKRVFEPVDFLQKDLSKRVVEGGQNGEKNGVKVCMLDSPLETFFLASIYLFGDVDNIDNRLSYLKDVLIKQKPFVEAYITGNYKYYLLGRLVPMIVVESALMKLIMEENEGFNFVIPKEGSLIGIENFALSLHCKNEDIAYKFINFMLSKENSVARWKDTGYNPSNAQCYDVIDSKFSKNNAFFPNSELFKKLYLLHNKVCFDKLERAWRMIKLA